MRRLKDFAALYRIYRQCHGPIKAARYAWVVSRRMNMQRPQLPGRIEALNHVLRTGISNASPDMLRISGMGRTAQRKTTAMPQTFTFSAGLEQLTQEQRAALPF